MPVPGIVLSSVAVILWVTTIGLEYRACLEQALAIAWMPTRSGDEELEMVTEDGELEVKGMSRCYKALSLLLLCIPRTLVMMWLGYVPWRSLCLSC